LIFLWIDFRIEAETVSYLLIGGISQYRLTTTDQHGEFTGLDIEAIH
jgi:hypothetical protein